MPLDHRASVLVRTGIHGVAQGRGASGPRERKTNTGNRFEGLGWSVRNAGSTCERIAERPLHQDALTERFLPPVNAETGARGNGGDSGKSAHANRR